MRVWLSAASVAVLVGLAACGAPSQPDGAAETPAENAAPQAAPPTLEPAPEPAPAPETDPETDTETAEAPEQTAAAVWPHDASDLPPDPAVRYGRLDNGMRYAVLVNDTPSEAAALRLRVDMGSIHEAEDQLGLAHFIEHMIFNGSENVPEGEMIRILERHGLAFGPDTNAYTSFDETVYQLDLPAVDAETLDTAFFLMRETADRVSFDADAIERERGVVLSEERVRNTYGLRYAMARWEYLFPDARFADRWPIGEVEVLETAPRERFVDLYSRYYAPERALLVVTGDVDADDMVARIQESFGDWAGPDAPGADPDLGEVGARGLEAGFFYDPDMPTVVTINAVTPAANLPDTADNRRAQLVRDIGARILTRRLQTLSRAPDAPFAQASAAFDEYYDAADLAVVQLISRPEDWRAALGVGEQELRRALEHGFTEAELAEQIANLRAGLQNAADQADTRESPALADAIAGAFAADAVFTHPRSALERFESYAGDITVADVEAAFRDAWGEGAPIVYLATNFELENAEAEILAAYAASQAVAVEAPDPAAAETFAYEDFGAPGVVAERTQIEDLGVTEVVFENAVRLNVMATDFEDETVRVSVRAGGGMLEVSPEAPGVAFLADFLSIGGLEAHSYDALQTLLAGRTVGLSFGAGADAFEFSAVTTPEDLTLQLQLFAAYLTAPGYREEGLTQYRQTVEIWYETLDATPQSVYSRDVPRLLRSGDPRYGVPAREELLAHDYAALDTVFARARNEGAVEIAVVGDVEVDAVIDAVAATFGALAPRRAEPEPFDAARVVAFPEADAAPVILRHAGEANRALALVFWPADDDSDALRTRRLRLLRSVFDLKLTERIREELGATYSPSAMSAFSSVNPGYGYLGVSLDLEPGEVDALYGVVDEIAASMVAGEISEDEVDRARRPILEQIEENLEQNEYWLSLISTAQTQPEYLDRHRVAADQYRSITREELIEAAAAYLRPETAYRVSILPPEQG